MRLCIFTSDLESVNSSREALIRQVIGDGEHHDVQVCLAGYRGRGAAEDRPEFHFPFEEHEPVKARIARTLFRVTDGTELTPTVVATAGLALFAPMLTEVVVACDPDAAVLDIRWGNAFKKELEREFPGTIYVLGKHRRPYRAPNRWRRVDASAKVSIVLPTFNGSKYIRQSIESCLDQTFRNIELIVVDDGSVEDIRTIVSTFGDFRVRYLRHDSNRGLPAALNTGFMAATGDYLTWTSDDNYYAPHAIERMVSFLQSYKDIDFVYSSCYIVDEMGLGNTLRIQTAKPVEHLKVANGVGACFLYSKKVYREIGDYNPKTFLAEDYDYWCRVSKRFRMQRLFEPLYYYRFHKDALTFARSRGEVADRVRFVKQQNGIA